MQRGIAKDRSIQKKQKNKQNCKRTNNKCKQNKNKCKGGLQKSSGYKKLKNQTKIANEQTTNRSLSIKISTQYKKKTGVGTPKISPKKVRFF